MRLKLLVLTLWFVAAFAASSTANAAWSTYFGPATMYHSNYSKQVCCWNYYTNNRVYRPTGHPFQLWYQINGGPFHYSAENYSTNPFYFPSFGYNVSGCTWAYWDDLSPSVSPVTCQAYV